MECKHIVLVIVMYLSSCSSVSAVVRRYYIAAVDVEWDYAPSQRDLIFSHQRYVENSAAFFSNKMFILKQAAIAGKIIYHIFVPYVQSSQLTGANFFAVCCSIYLRDRAWFVRLYVEIIPEL